MLKQKELTDHIIPLPFLNEETKQRKVSLGLEAKTP